MQLELNEEYPNLKIQILGVNERGHEFGNVSVTAGRQLPWLQDVDSDQDGRSDNFMNQWDYEYRDVVLVDASNIPIATYNLTEHDLSVPENFDTLRQMLIDAAGGETVPSWTNPAEPLDVNNDTFISPLDALLILNEINLVGAHQLDASGGDALPPPYLDPSGDGFVSPLDALLVINQLNLINSVSVQTAAAVPAQAATDAVGGELAGRAAANAAAVRSSLLAAAIDDVFQREGDERRDGE